MKRSYIKRSTKKLGRSKKPHKQAEQLLDDLWRTIIRLRDKGKCQYTGKVGKDVHHIFSRSNFNTRWDLSNGILLHSAHQWGDAHKNPQKFISFLINNWFKSIEVYNCLYMRSQMRWDKDRSAVYVYLMWSLKQYVDMPEDWQEMLKSKKEEFLLQTRKNIGS